MGERRKRRSMWDMEDETKHFSGMSKENSFMGKEHQPSHDRGSYHELSGSRAYTSQRSRDHSGQPSWGSIEENPVAQMNGGFTESRQNAPEGKEPGAGNRYYQNMSPEFGGMELHKYNHSLENDRNRSHGHRYPGRARSRSRSRSRSMPRGRSRSRSLSRGGGRERGRGRSRSRSRSPSDGTARDQTRSRSPIGDYRHQSHGWSDRNIPDKSTQICKDFDSGRCRRGSQCRFLHPSREDGDILGDETAESRRNRADRAHISKNSYSRDGVSDPYLGQNEQFQNRSRNAAPCKDFVKGKCRWGDTCRFSHHFASSETFGKGNVRMSSDNDIEHEPCENEKPLCKYFAAGKCDRDNCRFSHEDPKLNSREGRQVEVSVDHSLRDKSNRRDILIRNDATSMLDNLKPYVWSEPVVAVTSNTPTAAKKGSRWGHSLEDENMTRGEPESAANSVHQDKQPYPLGGSGNYGGEMNSNLQGQNRLLENRSLSMTSQQQNVPPLPNIQLQDHVVGENSIASSLNGFGGDFNGSETHLAVRLSLQSQMQNDQNAVQMPQFLPNLLTSEHPALLTNPGPLVNNMDVHSNPVRVSGDPIDPVDNGRRTDEHENHTEQENQVLASSELNDGNRVIGEESKGFQNFKQDSETRDGHGKAEESIATKDDKGIRIFKNSLIEFVKEILKPTWKEGRMSREVHKTIVKKVVDKVTSTIQADQIPKTQEKVEQYLSYSKPKIAKLVQAYVGRSLKKDS